MVPLTKLEETFFAFIDELGETFPDGGSLTVETQIEILTHLAKVAVILGIDFPL